ncbi:unnamed protein product [Caenorhabditis auriculariae]|uniref:Uncharacterized protein n=1 Tax=Caenorhabditis auriculariae TaxID=2777116 RepID=A0A8S1HVT1_9PELO|nr:unnamed protein product [Caenorhabditis auriculariae]
MFKDPIISFLLSLSCLFQVSAIEGCCKRTMLSYPSGAAIPPECEKLRCTEAPILIENPKPSFDEIAMFLAPATKISTLTVIDNEFFIFIHSLENLVHKGPGPAISFRNAKMHESCFKKLQKITVDDIRPYCKGEKLIVVEGKIDETVRQRLETVANQTLADCAKLTTLAPSTTTEAINTTTVTTEAPTTTEEAVNTTTTIATTTEPEINTTTVTTIATTTPEPTTRTTTTETLETTTPDTTVAPDEAISSTTTATKSPPQNCVGAAALAPAAEEKECPSTSMIVLPGIVVIIFLILALGIVSYIAFIKNKSSPNNRPNSKNNSKELSSLGVPIERSKEAVEASKRKDAGKDFAVFLNKETETREETPKERRLDSNRRSKRQTSTILLLILQLWSLLLLPAPILKICCLKKNITELCPPPGQTCEQSEKIINIEKKERASTLFSDVLNDFESLYKQPIFPEKRLHEEKHKENLKKLNTKI